MERIKAKKRGEKKGQSYKNVINFKKVYKKYIGLVGLFVFI